MLQPIDTSVGAGDCGEIACGDVFLTSFEWSTASSNASLSSDSDSQRTEKDCLYQGSEASSVHNYVADLRRAASGGKVPQTVESQKVVSSQEGVKCIKRPVSVISSNSSGSRSPTNRESNREYADSDNSRVTKKPYTLPSNRLADIIQCYNGHQDQRVLITSASYPYHVEWVSSAWSKMCGWTSDEVLGKSCSYPFSSVLSSHPAPYSLTG